MIVSHDSFMTIVSVLAISVSAVWFLLDLLRLVRDLRRERTPRWRDLMFGYLIGMTCGVIGIIGVYRYYLG